MKYSVIGVALGATLLAGCTVGDTSKAVPLPKGPPAQTVSGPYDSALGCLAQVPEVKTVRIAVGEITDKTGRENFAEGGTGSFVTKGATDMFYSSLADLGVQLVELTPDYRGVINWLGPNPNIERAQFIVFGSIPSLDFLPGSVAELVVYGFGPKARAYQAVGRMDVRLTTLPFKKQPGGVVVASTSVEKQFTAVENEFGVATFLGASSGLTFASFRIGSGAREPMQYAIGYMADYAAFDLIAQLVEDLSAQGKITDRRSQIAGCRRLLDDPYGTENAQAAPAA